MNYYYEVLETTVCLEVDRQTCARRADETFGEFEGTDEKERCTTPDFRRLSVLNSFTGCAVQPPDKNVLIN